MSSIKVYSRFMVKKRDGTELKLRIQDLPSDRLEDALDFNFKYFGPDESFQKATGVFENKEIIEKCRNIMRGMMQTTTFHASICCLDDDDNAVGEIIGVSSVDLKTKEDVDDFTDIIKQVDSEEITKLFTLVSGLNAMHDVFEKFGVERYYDGRGVGVHPNYRGLGIATEFLRTRRMVCKDHGVPFTVALMSSLGTQKAAERDGWQTSFEITFDEVGKMYEVTFDKAPPTCKAMYAEIK